MSRIVYLDNNATTRALPEVVAAMGPFLSEQYANPSSIHQFGQSVRHAMEIAREQVASLIGATAKEIIFTSGGTESINLAIRGALAANAGRAMNWAPAKVDGSSPAPPEGGGSDTRATTGAKGCASGGVSAPQGRRHVVTTAVEHSAVMRVCEQLEREGYRVDYVGVDGEGRVNEDEWRERITDGTALVSFMHANNETGVMFDVPRLATIARERGAIVHVDAVQSAGKVPIDITSWPVNLVSLAAHKFHGPKGVGALYVQRRTRIAPMILGGSHERELRGGTENVAGIVGMGVASELAKRDMNESSVDASQGLTNPSPSPCPLPKGERGFEVVARDSAEVARSVGAMRDALEAGILSRFENARVNGGGAERIYNTSNISFEGLATEAILILLSEAGICVSSGAACSSGSLEPSHVLKAMGLSDVRRHGAIRFSLSRINTPAEIDEVVRRLPELLRPLTSLARGKN